MEAVFATGVAERNAYGRVLVVLTCARENLGAPWVNLGVNDVRECQ